VTSTAEAIDDFIVEVETLRADDPHAALDRIETAPRDLAQRPESRLLAADLTWELEGAKLARPLLEALVKDVPDYADARHLLGATCEELGDESAKIEQFLEVLRLDEGLEEALEEDDAEALQDLIVQAAEVTIDRLPKPFRDRLSGVPVLVEERPSEDLVREGFDPRALGLFEGPTHVEHQNGETDEVPTRIVLYSSNLLAESIDEEQLREEVETTVLHEVGHYFGLGEDDLVRLGLD
jgi:predicted Zn-dependent protease with MMP-like domain